MKRMTKHLVSDDDLEFMRKVECCEHDASEFGHRAHVRLAYVYLASGDTESAIECMRNALFGLLRSAGIDPSRKYHETLTRAWILAVRHFMEATESCDSADDFIARNTRILDSSLMMTHYSTEVLFSDAARNAFVAPDLDPIPRHGE